MTDDSRYARQIAFAPIGDGGQKRLRKSRVVLVGCGALGSVSSSLLVRAGVGFLRLIDSDTVEVSNLQRQILFTEEDVGSGLSKAEIARNRLSKINSEVELEAFPDRLTAGNAAQLLAEVDLIVDATDNFETRYVINEFSVESGTPWVFGAAAASEGRVMAVIPGKTPCLRCIIGEQPSVEETPTAGTHGIIGPLVAVVASMQATEALKLLTGCEADLQTGMLSIDVWRGTFRTTFAGADAKDPNCPVCGQP